MRSRVILDLFGSTIAEDGEGDLKNKKQETEIQLRPSLIMELDRKEGGTLFLA
jgi:hypothetical protein